MSVFLLKEFLWLEGDGGGTTSVIVAVCTTKENAEALKTSPLMTIEEVETDKIINPGE